MHDIRLLLFWFWFMVLPQLAMPGQRVAATLAGNFSQALRY
jgi:hypothetical protein